MHGGDARPQHKDGQKENGKKTGDPWAAANQSARGSRSGGSSALLCRSGTPRNLRASTVRAQLRDVVWKRVCCVCRVTRPTLPVEVNRCPVQTLQFHSSVQAGTIKSRGGIRMHKGEQCLPCRAQMLCPAGPARDFVQKSNVLIPVSRMEVPVPSLQQAAANVSAHLAW